MAAMTAQQAPAAPGGTAAPGRLLHRRVRLPAGSAAAALAVAAVRAAIGEWQVPTDSGLAGMLASDLVISVIDAGPADPEQDLTLSVRCAGGRFRVEVHGPSPAGDSWESTGTRTARGMQLAAATAAESGHYRTPAGRAAYYALALPPGAAPGGGQPPQGAARGVGEP
jgi:hypothetical protein